MSKKESFFNGFSKVFNVTAFSGIVLVVGLLVLKSVLEYRIETKQEVVVEVMKSATQDTQEAKASVMRALMSQEAFRKVAAPWIIRITSLEYQGYYPERDTLYSCRQSGSWIRLNSKPSSIPPRICSRDSLKKPKKRPEGADLSCRRSSRCPATREWIFSPVRNT